MPEPVRLLAVVTVRFGKNGIVNSAMNYIKRLDPARIRCDLVALNEPGEEVRAAIARTGGETFILSGRNRNPVAYMRELCRIVRLRNEEIVHAHGNSATLAFEMLAAKHGGAKTRIPHSHNTSCKMKTADKLLRGLFYKSYTHAMACSSAAGEWLYPHRAFEVLNNAIDTECFRFQSKLRENTRESLGIEPDETVFLHVGTFNDQKNQSFLLEAFAIALMQNEKARLVFAGDGIRRASCEARAEALGIRKRVDFLGSRDDIPQLLSAADLFVLPSLHEGLPLTLVEAQCAGLPCLASDRITPDSALTPLVSFSSIDSADAYAKQMVQMTKVDREKESEEAIRLVAKAGYDVSQNAETLMRRYETLARS